MTRRIGVWVDHEKAVIVTLENGDTDVRTVVSGVGRRVRTSGGSRSRTPYGPQHITSDSQRQGKYQKHLTEFYRLLIGELRDADSVYILGPGEAKGELRKEIEAVKPLRGKIAAVVKADKMTENELIVAVRSFFAK